MIKIKTIAKVYYEKQTKNNLVYQTELEVESKKDLKNLEKTLLKVTRIDAELVGDYEGSYIVVINNTNYIPCINEQNDKVILEKQC